MNSDDFKFGVFKLTTIIINILILTHYVSCIQYFVGDLQI
jgi:hypothetical protein